MITAADYIDEQMLRSKPIYIYTDSTAALKDVFSHTQNHKFLKIVQVCVEKLNTLVEKIDSI